jgi:5'-AMP-activated protein kinase catalytic alpha subunit
MQQGGAAPRQGSVKIGPYVLGRTLGVGSFGKVKLAQHELTGHRVAVKILNRKKIQSLDMDDKVRREIKTLKLFSHPHITRLYEVIDTPTDIFVIIEYVSEGELFDFIVEKGRLSEGDARRFFQQIISGVDYCHRHMVVHRDLKPENLLLDSDFNLKIADFGLSNMMKDGYFLKTSCGSPNYAAPEVLSGKLYAGPEVDVWSCGVILYALLCGSLPFDDESIPNLFKKIKGGIYSLPGHISDGVRDLIPRMLVVDPCKRITIAEIRQHQWFRVSLPRYIAMAVDDRLVMHRKVDPEALGQVSHLFKMNAATAREMVTAVARNEVKVAYNLILDHIERVRRTQDGGLGDEMLRSLSSGSDLSAMEDGSPRMLAFSPRVGTTGGGAAAPPDGESGGSGALSVAPPPVVVPAIEPEGGSWNLGLTTSWPSPAAIMTEIYRALRTVGSEWKTITPYLLKCRHEMPATPEGAAAAVVKFSFQVYKLPDGKYLLDMHKTSGDVLCFVEICQIVMAELKL